MDNILLEIFDILKRTGLSKHLLLIGSWAEFLYEKCNVIDGFVSNIKTRDVDFLIENVNKPRESIDILSEFKKQGFEIDVTGYETYRIIKGEFEVEFLAARIGGSYRFKPVPALKLPNVQALSHIRMLLLDPCEISYKGFSITVPNPYNYVIHKMIINDRRNEKAEKDKQAIKNLLIFLDSQADHANFVKYYNRLTKREKRKADQFIEANSLESLINFDEDI